jgi:hypothetical protein
MKADKRSKGLTDIPEKLLKIAADIAERGNANLTRLTVLKKWFGHPGRLPPFAIWVASRAISGKGKTGVEATELFRQARALLARVNPYRICFPPCCSHAWPRHETPGQLFPIRQDFRAG